MEYQWDHVPDAAELAEVYRKQLDEQAKRIEELEERYATLDKCFSRAEGESGEMTYEQLDIANCHLSGMVTSLSSERDEQAERIAELERERDEWDRRNRECQDSFDKIHTAFDADYAALLAAGSAGMPLWEMAAAVVAKRDELQAEVERLRQAIATHFQQRLRHGHNDTCQFELTGDPCNCGFALLAPQEQAPNQRKDNA